MVPSLVAIAAAVLGAVLPLVLIGNSERVPEVTVIIPETVGVGERFDIHGTNLDLVTEMLLVKGGTQHRLDTVYRDDTQWTVVLLAGQATEGEYSLKLRTGEGKLFTLGGKVFVKPISTAPTATTAAPNLTATPAPTLGQTLPPSQVNEPPTAPLLQTSSIPTPTPMPMSAPTPTPTAPPKLFVIKTVVNDNGGTSAPSDFTINVSATDPSSASFPGDGAGTTITMGTGAYSVAETGPAGYAESQSGDCSGTIREGESKTCIITNDDIAPTPTATPMPLPAPAFLGTFALTPDVDATVTALQFYEFDPVGPPGNQGIYTKTFDRSTLDSSSSRYIYYELTISHPASGKRTDFFISARCHQPDGLWRGVAHKTNVEGNWTTSQHFQTCGRDNSESYQVGIYNIEISVNGELVAGGHFEVTQ